MGGFDTSLMQNFGIVIILFQNINLFDVRIRTIPMLKSLKTDFNDAKRENDEFFSL